LDLDSDLGLTSHLTSPRRATPHTTHASALL
jgi:hypothetical protein